MGVAPRGSMSYSALSSKTFSDLTPEEIAKVIKSGRQKELWKVGDEHDIKLTTGEYITIQIADFDHDKRPDGTVIPVTVVMKGCFNSTSQMTAGNYTNGWLNGTFRNSKLPTYVNYFPARWLSIIPQAVKYSAAGSASSTIQASSDTMWLLSEIEVFGTRGASYAGEGFQYEIFKTASNRIKKRAGSATDWWERSATNVTSRYAYVTSGGAMKYYDYQPDAYKGICLAFGLGK